jgi:hypothetical protein
VVITPCRRPISKKRTVAVMSLWTLLKIKIFNILLLGLLKLLFLLVGPCLYLLRIIPVSFMILGLLKFISHYYALTLMMLRRAVSHLAIN